MNFQAWENSETKQTWLGVPSHLRVSSMQNEIPQMNWNKAHRMPQMEHTKKVVKNQAILGDVLSPESKNWNNTQHYTQAASWIEHCLMETNPHFFFIYYAEFVCW